MMNLVESLKALNKSNPLDDVVKVMKESFVKEEKTKKIGPSGYVCSNGEKSVTCKEIIEMLSSNQHTSKLVGYLMEAENLIQAHHKLIEEGNIEQLIKEIKKTECSNRRNDEMSPVDETLPVDETVTLLRCCSGLTSFILSLPQHHRHHVVKSIINDTTLWLSKIFRYPTERAICHYDEYESLSEITRLALSHHVYDYKLRGYESLINNPALIYINVLLKEKLNGLCSLSGLPRDTVCCVPADPSKFDCETMDVKWLEDQIMADMEENRKPVLVIACAGTPRLGQLDHIYRLAEFCSKHSIWLHCVGNDLALLPLLSVPVNLAPATKCNSLTLNLPAWLKLQQLPYVTLIRDNSEQVETDKDKPMIAQNSDLQPFLSTSTTQQTSISQVAFPLMSQTSAVPSQTILSSTVPLISQILPTTSHTLTSQDSPLSSQTLPMTSQPRSQHVTNSIRQGMDAVVTTCAGLANSQAENERRELNRRISRCMDDARKLMMHGNRTKVNDESNSETVISSVSESRPVNEQASETVNGLILSTCVNDDVIDDVRMCNEAELQRFLPYWLTLQNLGHDGLSARITHSLKLANVLHEKLRTNLSIQIISSKSKSTTEDYSLRSFLFRIISSLLVLELRSPVCAFRYRPISCLCHTDQDEPSDSKIETVKNTSEENYEQKNAFNDYQNDEENEDRSTARPLLSDPGCESDKKIQKRNQCDKAFVNRLNEELYDHLKMKAKDRNIDLSLLKSSDLNTCIIFSPLEDVNALNSTVEDVNLLIEEIESKLKYLKKIMLLNCQLRSSVELNSRLQYIEDHNSETIGSVRYLTEGVEVSGSNLILSERIQVMIHESCQSSCLLLGRGSDGLVCISMSRSVCYSEMEALLRRICEAGDEARANIKQRRTSEILFCGIDKSFEDFSSNNFTVKDVALHKTKALSALRELR